MAKDKKVKATGEDFAVLVKPVVTEKSSLVGEVGSCVTFQVAQKLSLIHI